MPRLFTGIEIPGAIKQELARLHMPLPGARWVEPAGYHLTLRFAGDIDNRKARDFAEFLGQIEAHAFELRLVGLGAFGGNDPKSVFAQVEPSEALEQLARAHERAARNAGLEPEKRNFKPHVTLARLKYSDAERVARFLSRYGGFRSAPFTVTQFVLFSSKPQVGGGPYVVEETFAMTSFDYDEDGEY